MSCTRSDTGARILRGRHTDTCPDPDTCVGCQPCTLPHCRACRHEHADAVCPACLLDVRTDLSLLGGMAGHLPAQAANGRPAYAVHEGVPGGDALVMSAPGATRQAVQTVLAQRALDGLDTTHAGHELPGDPVPPLVLLTGWVDAWQLLMHHEARPPTTDVAQAVEYLARRLDMMAHLHPGTFLAMSGELATGRRRVEDLLHAGERPNTSRVPCWECGTRLVKVFAAKVGNDHWLCPRCGEMYNRGRYDRAMHDHLASTGANRFVYATDATAAIGRPVQTVRSWIRRGQVETDRDPSNGRLRVWWPDVRHAHLAQRFPTAPSRPASLP